MNINNLNFPVITFSRDNNIFYARNINDLVICTKRGFEQGFYKQLSIVDTKGNKYQVENAKKIENVGDFFGYNIFLSQKIKVELEFNQSSSIVGLDEFKDRLVKAYNLNSSFWDAGGDLENIINYIKNASSIKDIIHKLSSDYYREY